MSFQLSNAANNRLLVLLLISAIPVVWQAVYYPYGGWDAWSCWNFKAKFLFLGGDRWKNMFDPILWRSSPHYPLLLPLINVWTWIFLSSPSNLGPMATTVLFTILTAGLLFTAVKHFTQTNLGVLASLAILVLPFYGKNAVSQYSDIVLGYYLLGSVVCFLIAWRRESPPALWMSGSYIGLLSFTKPEGTIAAFLMTALVIAALLFKNCKKGSSPLLSELTSLRPRQSGGSNLMLERLLCHFAPRNDTKSIKRDLTHFSSFYSFLPAILIFSIPTILFLILYSPGNQSFINGFLSPEKPASLYRLKFIFAYVLVELKSERWNWIWILLLWGIILRLKKAFHKETLIIPLFLLFYGGIILFYYWMNTYFKIEWWLQVSLNRILVSFLPLCLLWVFMSLWRED